MLSNKTISRQRQQSQTQPQKCVCLEWKPSHNLCANQ